MQITVNGNKSTYQDAITVTDLIKHFKLAPQWVIVELNGEPLARDQYQQVLEHGDTIEMVRPVAGG
ncbi:MAG: sulfur carrier protein ThiS [Chlamydiota bacterium]|nr:sulfur carrier protein ThiS [Chlamydiota bacterium]